MATRMRFWPNSDLTAPVQWYFVPRDRPFLPLPHGWLWWDSERDPENEGIRRATGSLTLGEDYLTDKRWVDGKDPMHTLWEEGRYCGTEEQWRGENLPEPVPPPPHSPIDCCGHGYLSAICTLCFLWGGPRQFLLPTMFAPSKPPPSFPEPPRGPADPPIGWQPFGPAPIPEQCFYQQNQSAVSWTARAFREGKQRVLRVQYEQTFFGVHVAYETRWTARDSWDGLEDRELRRVFVAPSTFWVWPATTRIRGVLL